MSIRQFGLTALLALLCFVAGVAPVAAVYRDDFPQQKTPPAPADLSAVSAGSTKAAASAGSDAGPALYVVQLADAPLGAYTGGVGGLVATSAAATGQPKLDVTSGASKAYLNYLAGKRATTLDAIAALVGDTVAAQYVYANAFNGFAVTLTPTQADAVAALAGVKDVQRDFLQYLQTDTGPSFIGAAQSDLKPAIFSAVLDGAQDGLPAVAGKGRASIVYDAATKGLTVQVFYEGLTGAPNATGAHLHIGERGQNGGIVVGLNPLAVPGNSTRGGYVGSATIVDVPALSLTAAQVEQALFEERLYVNIHTAANPSGEIRGQVETTQGEGMVVGVLDSGVDFTSPSFKDPADDGFNFTNPRGSGNYLGVCNSSDGDGRFDPDFVCNDKLIGAYTFNSTDESPDPQGGISPRDNDGHGTHTGSTTAGNVVNNAAIIVPDTAPAVLIPVGKISGVAPHANVIVYDVCGVEPANIPTNSLSCSTAAILAGLDQALADKVDVINYSIGGGSRNPWISDDAEAFLVLAANGTFVSVSAGNSGPDAITIGAPSNAPWLMSVAASTHNRQYVNSVGSFSGGSSGTRPSGTITGKGFSTGLPATKIVYAGDFNDETGDPNQLCGPFATGTDFQGAIVLCERGTFGRVEKAENVKAAGGGGYVLANNAASGASLSGDVYPIPGVHVTFADGQLLIDWVNDCTTCQASIGGSTRAVDPAFGDILASFSSRGPDRTSPDVLKPDVAAPGVDILAAGLNVDPTNPDFEFLSGTSMAAPHVAGAATLVSQAHPTWTSFEVKSALMLTANATMLKEDGATASTPHDRGAGRINADLAVLSGLLLDESYANFIAADPARSGDAATLNLASLNENECAVTCVFTRKIKSSLGVTTTWTATAGVSVPLGVTVSPTSFTLAPGASQTLVVTASVSAAPLNTYIFGSLLLSEQNDRAPDAALPIAVRLTASTLPPAVTLAARTITGSVDLNLRAIPITDLTVLTYGLVKLTPEALQLAQDPTSDDVNDGEVGGIYTKTLTLPAGTTRYRVQLTKSTAPDLDLIIYTNSDGNGVLDDDETICSSATSAADEFCDIQSIDKVNGLSAPLPIVVLVQNYEGSRPDEPAFKDSFLLYSGLVGQVNAGNLTVTGPATVAGGTPFALKLAWNLTGAKEGDIYIGVVNLGSSSAPAPVPANLAAVGDLGSFPITLVYQPFKQYLPLIRR